MNRIDAHHHLWDPAVRPLAWLDGDGPHEDRGAALRRRFGPRDLRPQLDACGVGRTIAVQSVSEVEETWDLLRAAGSADWIAGVVGWLDLADPAVAEALAGVAGTRIGRKLVGLRHQVHDEADPRWLLRPAVLRGLRAVAERGLVYDLLVRERELPAALGAVRAVPGGVFVLDHCGKPAVRGGGARPGGPWSEGIRELAAEPNVVCKLSGLVTEAHWRSWTVADLLPYAAHVLDAFGPGRVLFGSDWPVCTLAADYGRVVAATAELLARCGVAPDSPEWAAVFGGNAARVYLERRAGAAGPPVSEG